MKRLLVFQHMPWEGPGQHLIRSAKKLGVGLDTVKVWHKPIPDISSKDAQTHEALMGKQFEVFFSNYVQLIS